MLERIGDRHGVSPSLSLPRGRSAQCPGFDSGTECRVAHQQFVNGPQVATARATRRRCAPMLSALAPADDALLPGTAEAQAARPGLHRGLRRTNRDRHPRRELHEPQPVTIDLCAGVPRLRACDSDAIADTIDYGELRARLHRLLREHRVAAAGGLAEQVARIAHRRIPCALGARARGQAAQVPRHGRRRRGHRAPARAATGGRRAAPRLRLIGRRPGARQPLNAMRRRASTGRDGSRCCGARARAGAGPTAPGLPGSRRHPGTAPAAASALRSTGPQTGGGAGRADADSCQAFAAAAKPRCRRAPSSGDPAARHRCRAPLTLRLCSALPSHAGLGSGTQLALAVGRAFCTAFELDLESRQLATLLGRGLRSGIGIAASIRAACCSTAARGADGSPGAGAGAHRACRRPGASCWCWIRACGGLSGAGEKAALAALPPLPRAAAAEICHQVLMRMLPGAAGAEFAPFAAGLSRMQGCWARISRPPRRAAPSPARRSAACCSGSRRHARGRHRPELLGPDRLRLPALARRRREAVLEQPRARRRGGPGARSSSSCARAQPRRHAPTPRRAHDGA